MIFEILFFVMGAVPYFKNYILEKKICQERKLMRSWLEVKYCLQHCEAKLFHLSEG